MASEHLCGCEHIRADLHGSDDTHLRVAERQSAGAYAEEDTYPERSVSQSAEVGLLSGRATPIALELAAPRAVNQADDALCKVTAGLQMPTPVAMV